MNWIKNKRLYENIESEIDDWIADIYDKFMRENSKLITNYDIFKKDNILMVVIYD